MATPTVINTTQLVSTFTQLCEIPSPFGREREIADLITKMLQEFGLTVTEDDTAPVTRAGSGNLLTTIEGPGPYVMFCAHIDTVPVEDKIEVVEQDGFLVNRHETILGADNKAAVAILVELARLFSTKTPPVGIELLFTTSEETGLRGAKAFDVGVLKSRFGYVFDHASPIGEVIVESPTHHRLTAEFNGKAAHAGIRPEDGVNAIEAACKAVGRMNLGRLDERTTANVGAIRGGTATNVVAERCKVFAEARSLDHSRSLEVLQQLVDSCNQAAGEVGCDLELTTEEEFRACNLSPDDTSVQVAAKALESLGMSPIFKPTGGGSDANAFMANGYECVNLANGTEANHTKDERVSVEALASMAKVSLALLEACRST